MKEVFNKINKNVLIAAFVVIFCISLSYLFNQIAVIDLGLDQYYNLSFQVYLDSFMRILSAFLIIPLFTFKRKEIENNSKSYLLGVVLVLVAVFFVLMFVSPLFVNKMLNNTTSTNVTDAWLFTLFKNFTLVFNILLTYFLYNMVFQGRIKESMLFSLLSLIVNILFTTLLISGVSPFEYQIWFSVFAPFLGSIIMLIFLVIDFFRQENTDVFQWKKLLSYFKKGILPGVETGISSLIYIFLTLSVVSDLGGMYQASWVLADTIILWGVMNVTLIFRYSLYYETINDKEYDFSYQVQKTYLLINILVFVTMTLFYEALLPLFIKGDEDWLHTTMITLAIMCPFMLLEEIKKQFEINLINRNMFIYILINTIINAVMIKIPIYTLNSLMVISLDYWTNMIVWASGITLVCSLTIGQYYYLNKKTA